MSNFKLNLTHDHETLVVDYCVQNGIEINQANAYDITMDAFITSPVMIRTTDEATGEVKEVNMTGRIARIIECQPKTVDRLADKVLLSRDIFERNLYKERAESAKKSSAPNLDKLVENLYRLNIVDGSSYLALVSFLMQMKYSRDGEVPENDKSCVFFNGVARNGKSATAKAICDFESQYGEIFCAKSGKLLDATHEERVWKSHLNYFDEVKPNDIDRELLLKIINGGEVELNPKNKRQYIQHVNTNNIFTSNDQICLKQRRVSIVKFGDRLNGRPLETGTLKKVVGNIMEALPHFDRYNEIYNVVNNENETRINALALEHIITFLTTKFEFVRHGDPSTLKHSFVFATHDVTNCIKDTYNKQIIKSERREAIVLALNNFVEKRLLESVDYDNCTTKHFKVCGENYLKIMEQFDQSNTRFEQHDRITPQELHDLLQPYFIDPKDDDDNNPKEKKEEPVTPEWMKDLTYEAMTSENPPPVLTEEAFKKGRSLLKRIKVLYNAITPENKEEMLYAMMTEETCRALTLAVFHFWLDDHYTEEVITQQYIQHTGLADPEVRKIAEKNKYNGEASDQDQEFFNPTPYQTLHPWHGNKQQEEASIKRMEERERRQKESKKNAVKQFEKRCEKERLQKEKDQREIEREIRLSQMD